MAIAKSLWNIIRKIIEKKENRAIQMENRIVNKNQAKTLILLIYKKKSVKKTIKI